MRTKSLILGAILRPFEGPWLNILEEPSWKVCVTTQPIGAKLHGEVELEVELMSGFVTQIPLTSTELEISGKRVRASILKEIEGVKSISVILEAENEFLV